MNNNEREKLYKTYRDIGDKIDKYDMLVREIKTLTNTYNVLKNEKASGTYLKFLINENWYFLDYINFDDIRYFLIEKTKEELDKKNKELMNL